MFQRIGLRVPSLLVALCFLGCLVVPAPARAENIGRTLGGAAGLAAGSMAGAALSSAVIGAAGIASMPALVPMLVSTAIVGASAWTGAKAFSRLGLELDKAAGPKAVWMMLGATLGTVAALALIPAVGPFVGPIGLVAKGLIGGLAGGVLFGLFNKQLDAIATPRNIYAAAGGTIGAVAGGVPGALAGVAGGFALGSVLDQGFFADEDKDWSRQPAGRNVFTDQRRYTDCRDDIEDWYYDRRDRFEERWTNKPSQYADMDECFYWQNDFGDDHYVAQQRPSGRGWVDSGQPEYLLQLKAAWQEAMAEFEEANIAPDTSARERQRLLQRVRTAQSAYEKALRQAQGY